MKLAKNVGPSSLPCVFPHGSFISGICNFFSLGVVIQVVAHTIDEVFRRLESNNLLTLRVVLLKVIGGAGQLETAGARNLKIASFDLLSGVLCKSIGEIQIDLASIEDSHHFMKWHSRCAVPAESEHAQAHAVGP